MRFAEEVEGIYRRIEASSVSEEAKSQFWSLAAGGEEYSLWAIFFEECYLEVAEAIEDRVAGREMPIDVFDEDSSDYFRAI